MKRERVLIVSDSPLIHSGLARVVSELSVRFIDAGYDVRIAGWHHALVPPVDPDELACLIYPIPKEILNVVERPILDFKPDWVVCIGDPSDFVWLAQQKANGAEWKMLGYLNIESSPMPPSLESTLDAFDVLITTSEFGAKALERHYVPHVLHGVNSDDFYPRTPPRMFADRDPRTTFIAFVNAQNVQRKNIAAAIQGFARFAEGKDDVFLYLNTKIIPTQDDPVGQSLDCIVLEEGIKHLVGFQPRNMGPADTVEDNHVNVMYAGATVLLHTSTGEGCGLPLLEALATNTPVIVTKGYSALEIVGENEERGYFIPPATKYRSPQGWDMLMVNPGDVASALDRAYEDWKAGEPFKAKCDAGREFAATTTWDKVFEVMFTEMLAQPNRSSRVANGLPIRPYLRQFTRAEVRDRRVIGVLKMGGLGDMLQASAVVRAAYLKWGLPVTVISNNGQEVFAAMPEVKHRIPFSDIMTQDEAARSVGDLFDIFLDLRYVCRGWGVPLTSFASKHAWFYENWGISNSRIDTLKRHTTQVMLDSLGLEGPITPVFEAREEVILPHVNMVALCSGGRSKLKLWPHWPDLTSTLLERGYDLVQIGGSSDKIIPGAYDYRGASLAHTASVLDQVDLLITNESAMMHLAAATKTRTVVIAGPTPVESFVYPGMVVATSPQCRPCFWALPKWREEECAIAEPSCINFPSADTVASMVQRIRG